MMKELLIFLLALILCIYGNSLLFAQAASDANVKPCMPCQELEKLRLPEISITEAEEVEQANTHCKVLGIISKEIKFELLLPRQWNARFVMKGNGAFAGGLENSMRYVIDEGFATVVTNTGHDSSPLEADRALHNMERQLNFGHMAVHRTAVASKAIMEHYYGTRPVYNYFIGCSRGGGEAMMEAQRYPEDFDGIVAGAPAIDWPALGANAIRAAQIMYPDPANFDKHPLTTEHLQLLQQAILKECDAMDGLQDNILNDPRDCQFNFSVLPSCPDKTGGQTCFTEAQLKAIKLIYSEITNKEGRIYPGLPFGEETDWQNYIVGPIQESLLKQYPSLANMPSLHYTVGTELYKYLIFQDPDWNYLTYDFSSYFSDTRIAAAYLNVTATDYSAFKDRGAKMIIYHGWNDHAQSAFVSIAHYEEVAKRDKELKNYLRLFLLPGVLHCSGGSGPDKANWLALIMDWVEKGQAPERLVMTKLQEGEVVMTRPVFPYPGKAVYKGKGDPLQESSFRKSRQ